MRAQVKWLRILGYKCAPATNLACSLFSRTDGCPCDLKPSAVKSSFTMPSELFSRESNFLSTDERRLSCSSVNSYEGNTCLPLVGEVVCHGQLFGCRRPRNARFPINSKRKRRAVARLLIFCRSLLTEAPRSPIGYNPTATSSRQETFNINTVSQNPSSYKKGCHGNVRRKKIPSRP